MEQDQLKSGEFSRREFLLRLSALTGAATFLHACGNTSSPHQIKGEVTGANSKLGHRLRTMDFPPVSQTIKTNVLIIGGGVAGLSAARELKKSNIDFLLLELESETGG
ncbi:MAG: NAD(P)-binding protein, partial [Bacteroidia bacterium]